MFVNKNMFAILVARRRSSLHARRRAGGDPARSPFAWRREPAERLPYELPCPSPFLRRSRRIRVHPRSSVVQLCFSLPFWDPSTAPRDTSPPAHTSPIPSQPPPRPKSPNPPTAHRAKTALFALVFSPDRVFHPPPRSTWSLLGQIRNRPVTRMTPFQLAYLQSNRLLAYAISPQRPYSPPLSPLLQPTSRFHISTSLGQPKNVPRGTTRCFREICPFHPEIRDADS